MFVKITQSGPRRYVQLVESYRDDEGKVKKRTIATLGRLDQISGELRSVIDGLLKITGLGPLQAPPTMTFESAKAFGDLWALHELWRTLGFHELQRCFRSARYGMDVEALIRTMVFNRLCDPESKLGVLRWLETVSIPGVSPEEVTHQRLLRSMDALIDHQDRVEHITARLLRPLIDQDLSVVFYDMTTIRAEGLSEQLCDIRQFGMSKEGGIARQFMLGVVQTAEGIPLYHEVFEGNRAESPTLLPMIQNVLARYPSIRRLILVADRGLLSLDNLEALSALRMSEQQPLEFILAVPGRRYAEFAELLQPFHEAIGSKTDEQIGETRWQDYRLVVAHDPLRALEQTQERKKTIQALIDQGEQWAGKLGDQDYGVKSRGRKLSDSGAKARFYHAVCEAHLSKIIQVDLKSDLFAYDMNEQALALAERMDGKLLLVTNTQDLSPSEVVSRYKSLADIERGFRVLKSELEIGPVYHRLPERIRAHAMICFLALILHRVIRLRLRAANSPLSPERALEVVRRIQKHRIKLNDVAPVSGLSSITEEQAKIYQALKIQKPSASEQNLLL